VPAIRLATAPDNPDPDVIGEGARLIRSGQLVAFPTETVYGLGADATNEAAVRKVFEAKGRPANDPLIVHIDPSWPLDMVFRSTPPEIMQRLTESFWPGPLTIIGERSAAIAPSVTNDGPLVAVRAPSHPVAQALIAAAGVPIAAPSANRFSYVSPTSADHVQADLGERCSMIIDAGRSTLGIESTVVALRGDAIEVLRHGATPVEELIAAVGDLATVVDPAEINPADATAANVADAEVSPGRSVRHYSPNLTTIAVESDLLSNPQLAEALGNTRVAHLGYLDRHATGLPQHTVTHHLGSLEDLPGVAWELYEALRQFDQPERFELLILELTAKDRVGRAIDDRIRRAASGNVARTLNEIRAALAGH